MIASMTAPRRSCLSVPASSDRMVTKARTLEVDEIILDLEDAVVPDAKDDARARVREAVAEEGWAARRVAVRVNGLGTPWCEDDIAALAAAGGVLESIILPKAEQAADLASLDHLLEAADAGADRPLRVQALIESAAGLQSVAEIAAASPRLDALILGYADLAASLGRTRDGARELDLWAPAQHAVLTAARAQGLHAIDGPWLGTTVDEPFLAAATRARDLGFDGKWAIHPVQTASLEELFTPDEDELVWAREVLAALDGAREEGGRGAVALDGQMLDEAVAVAARRTLERAGENV